MRMPLCLLKRMIYLLVIAASFFFMIQFFKNQIGYNSTDESYGAKLKVISQGIKNSNYEAANTNGDGTPACKLPHLDISNPEIMKFIHNVAPLQCSPEDWVKAEGSKLYIDDLIKNRYGSITCAINEIIRVDDFKIKFSPTVEIDHFYILRKSDYAEVKCESDTGKQWHSVIAAVKEDPMSKLKSSWAQVPSEVLQLNVLMFGFDSLSRNTFERKLPRSYRYMQQTLGTLVLEGYNIVGDGTPQALIPILTGKIEPELPDTRKRLDNTNFVDVYPMIWKDYKKAGFITGFMEDLINVGTFTYRLNGFDLQPTDHYMRPYYLAATPYFKYSKPYCLGGTPRHMLMMNHIKAVFDQYKNQPKFVFGFHGELSHDSYNDIGVADEDVLNWLNYLKQSGHLNNTILIFMSDHGHRFASIRDTLQGKQEERLPFFSFTFPSWFKQAYPQAYANFMFNTQLLTTPFDIHATLKHALNFRPPKEGDLSHRGISLFDKIPIERSCADAFIEPHWCACLSWQEISINLDIVKKAADYFIDFLNSYTREYHDRCDRLYLGKILWAAKLIPTKGLLNFEKTQDADGFVADLSAQTQITTELYQLKVKTLPGEGLFEASIVRNINSNNFSVKIQDVSRINMYGSQARCVENDLFHLRKYCHCKY